LHALRDTLFTKKLDGVGMFLALIYWLVVAVAILALVIIVALLAGAFGTPELQQQIRDAMRTVTAPQL
jgi:acyl-coenzyme A synthetase/AMP-(fatty) acid ligase